MLVLPIAMVEKKFNVHGMHCKSCEILVMDELLEIDGVKNIKASFQEGTVSFDYKGEIEDSVFKNIIRDCGFEVE